MTLFVIQTSDQMKNCKTGALEGENFMVRYKMFLFLPDRCCNTTKNQGFSHHTKLFIFTFLQNLLPSLFILFCHQNLQFQNTIVRVQSNRKDKKFHLEQSMSKNDGAANISADESRTI